MGTVEKLTLENMGIAFGNLSLGDTEPETHLGGHLRPIVTYVLINTIATLGLMCEYISYYALRQCHLITAR